MAGHGGGWRWGLAEQCIGKQVVAWGASGGLGSKPRREREQEYLGLAEEVETGGWSLEERIGQREAREDI